MQQWQHVAVKVERRSELNTTLEEYSEHGWELVSVSTMQGMTKEKLGGGLGYVDVPYFQWDLFFKRPKE